MYIYIYVCLFIYYLHKLRMSDSDDSKLKQTQFKRNINFAREVALMTRQIGQMYLFTNSLSLITS